MRILIVEDDSALARGLVSTFKGEGLAVDHLTLGCDALAMASSEAYGAIVLDLGLPDMDGLAVLRKIRQRGIKTPILILTARDALGERVTGLDAGADDYLSKPFDPPELKARVRALLRRGQGMPDPIIIAGPLALDLVSRTALLDDVPLSLRRRELAVLECLMRRAGKVVSRERIAAEVFGIDDEVAPNALEVQIARLRGKIGPYAHQIRTIRGLGYILDTTAGNER
jgi:two-component system response regulator TctD